MTRSLYDEQTVEEETRLVCDELAGEGVSSDEIAYGLWPVMAGFAALMTDAGMRQGMAELLERLARDLRTQPPAKVPPPPHMARRPRPNVALLRLRHLAEQEWRI